MVAIFKQDPREIVNCMNAGARVYLLALTLTIVTLDEIKKGSNENREERNTR